MVTAANAVTIALLLLSAQVPSADSTMPDFAGRWTLAEPLPPPSGIATELLVALKSEQSNEGTTRIVTVRRTMSGIASSTTYRIGYVGGGVRPDGTVTRVAAAWHQGTLVLESGTYPVTVGPAGRSTEHVERWTLDSEGRLVIDIEDRRPNAEPVTTRATYRRPTKSK